MMTRQEIATELKRIGSTYQKTGSANDGWHHVESQQEYGKELVRELIRLNREFRKTEPMRPAAWGPRERGTIVCINCGKRGQDEGCVCDHCGMAL